MKNLTRIILLVLIEAFRRSRTCVVAALIGTTVFAAASASAAPDQTVDTQSAGTPFSPGVRGQALPAINIWRSGYTTGVPQTLAISRGTSIRGYVGGLESDLFNWKTRNNDRRATVLEYQRHARDYESEMVFTTNMRGLTRLTPAPGDPWRKEFYDTSTETLTSLAADWVRYSNRITQIYRQGDAITNERDLAVLRSLVWNTGGPDRWDTLPRRGESVPKVKYWEIGNEPRVSLVNTYQVTNGYDFKGESGAVAYRDRYISKTTAMLAEDATIKVGPGLQGLSGEGAIMDRLLSSPARVDFISYHPYQRLNWSTTPADIEAGLAGIYNFQKAKVDFLRNRMTANGRDPSGIELIASEINVSAPHSNERPAEARMAHALGSVETVFSLARLDVHAAHYWLWPANPGDGTEYPVYRAYAGLQDHMGDTLLSNYSEGLTRLYTTRDSQTGEIAVWGLNFDNDDDAVVNLALRNLTGLEKVTLLTLGAVSGDTDLNTSNLASNMPGGPTNLVDWTSTDLTGQLNFNDFDLTLADATISVLVIQPVPEPAISGIALAGIALLGLRRTGRRPAFTGGRDGTRAHPAARRPLD